MIDDGNATQVPSSRKKSCSFVEQAEGWKPGEGEDSGGSQELANKETKGNPSR
jgi:hypothetical protein